MNWNRVVTVLILLFLMINILLYGNQLLQESKRHTLSDERVYQLKKLLDREGVGLYKTIPKYYPKKQIELQAPVVDKDTIVRNILGTKILTQLEVISLGERIYNENESVTFYLGDQDGYIYYKSTRSSYVPTDMTVDSVEKIALKFAADLFGEDVDMVITYRKDLVNSEGNGYNIELNERFKDETIFQSFIKLYITANGIDEALAVRYKPIDYIGNEKDIYPFDEVIYNLMYYLQDDLKAMDIEDNVLKKTILFINIGYYLLDVDKNKYSYQLDPYYRIIFEDGDTYYINAYTNEIIIP